MKRLMMSLCLILIASTCSFSQDTLKITSEQLRITNLIFNEHNKLQKENKLLNDKINNLNLINKSWENTDSLRKIKLDNYYNTINAQNKKIDELNKSIKIKNNTLYIGGIISIVLLCLLIK